MDNEAAQCTRRRDAARRSAQQTYGNFFVRILRVCICVCIFERECTYRTQTQRTALPKPMIYV